MKRIMISAMNSGSGKTVLTSGLLKALQKRGRKPEEFKCGPDYIDPMFGRRVLGIPCKNLDLFLQGEEGLKRTLFSQIGEIGILEGAMGYFDGIGGGTEGSAWQVAAMTDTPVILVLRPSGVGITLAAQVKGLMNFRQPNQIAGLILNDCKESLYIYLKPLLERECGIPLLGYLPTLPEAVFDSRHLGLVTADELEDFDERIEKIAEALEEYCNLDQILELAREVEPEEFCDKKKKISGDPKRLQKEDKKAESKRENSFQEKGQVSSASKCTIAIARDKAFCFYYEENLRALEQAGTKLVYFSPLKDQKVPEADGLYLGGGYPELYAKELGENASMRQSILEKLENGLPYLAECGGFLYLQKSLGNEPMVGLFPGEGFETKRLQRFGYLHLKADKDSMLFRAGEAVPAHEFHYWDCSENGQDLKAEKPNGRSWECGYCSEQGYAGFPHLHFGGKIPLAERFAAAAEAYGKKVKIC